MQETSGDSWTQRIPGTYIMHIMFNTFLGSWAWEFDESLFDLSWFYVELNMFLFSQIGKTKVFLKAGQMAELDDRRTEVLGRAACIIQWKFRSYQTRKSFIMLRSAAIYIQAVYRGI